MLLLPDDPGMAGNDHMRTDDLGADPDGHLVVLQFQNRFPPGIPIRDRIPVAPVRHVGLARNLPVFFSPKRVRRKPGHGFQVFLVRAVEEVDFVVQRDLQVSELIQVCADAQDPDTRRREMRALVKAADKLKCDRLLLLTREEEGEEEFEWFGMKGTIRAVPLWKWLLEISKRE